ncbi:MAG: GNAT family N-acetyltransferase [Microthrixaceae bacterium]
MPGDPGTFWRQSGIAPTDLRAVLALNAHWVPHVGALDAGALEALVGQCEQSIALWARPGDAVGLGDGPRDLRALPSGTRGVDPWSLAGFVIVMGPGADYRSPNFRFFAEHHDLFTYVDRIAVAPWAQGRGVGRLLYERVFSHSLERSSPVVCAEVNLDPPNPDSLAFHQAMGFVGVGTQWTYDHTVQVQLLEHQVPPGSVVVDRERVATLLGREPSAGFEVVVRRGRSGDPVVIRNEPFMDDRTPMPTLYYLVDPDLLRRIGRLEADGGVKQAETDVGLAAIDQAHRRYAAERDATIDPTRTGPRPNGGVGGTRRGVKCLHAHYAYHLAGGDDPVGRWVEAHLREAS